MSHALQLTFGHPRNLWKNNTAGLLVWSGWCKFSSITLALTSVFFLCVSAKLKLDFHRSYFIQFLWRLTFSIMKITTSSGIGNVLKFITYILIALHISMLLYIFYSILKPCYIVKLFFYFTVFTNCPPPIIKVCHDAHAFLFSNIDLDHGSSAIAGRSLSLTGFCRECFILSVTVYWE